MFLPATKKEMEALGWSELDVILVSGDAYVDSSYMGIAVIGKLLHSYGFKVGIIAQPDVSSGEDIKRLGEPKLFWGVSAGCVDSMVANYTASLKKRKHDDFTPGGLNTKRPDRATIKYTNLIRQHFKSMVPIVLGGIEASLRRIVHYDYWSDKLRRSILLDSKADYLIYGMGEKSVLELAHKLKYGNSPKDVKGLAYLSNEPVEGYINLPSYEECVEDKHKFIEAFNLFYLNNDPVTAKGLNQKHGNRYYVQNPPQPNPTTEEIDYYYNLEYERDLHPFHKKEGKVKALDTIRYSITTHRGCYGECNFCAIAVHQGRTIYSRSEKSILSEVESFTKDKNFKGVISDIGGPTANMYGYECAKKLKLGSCDDKRCVHPDTCKALRPTHKPQLELLKKIRNTKGIKKAFVASGIRYDLIVDDNKYGYEYLKDVVKYHTSGQMKIAPEHVNPKVLDLMGKPGNKYLLEFKELFYKYNREAGKNQFLTYYFIAAHPGSSDKEMSSLKNFASEKLQISPEQVQIFTPTPSTYSTLMYYTEINPFTGEKVFVEKGMKGKNRQKELLIDKQRKKFRRYKRN